MPELRVQDIIMKKRDGEELGQEEIDYFVKGVVDGSVTEAQTGAMLMAMFLQGMSVSETSHLTGSMIQSGEVLSWPEEWRQVLVDKHSTGGVGDKVSLPLAPALATFGLKVPMISGRGLGHTGGTLDKLESIPGFQVTQSSKKIISILDKVGCCIVGQTSTLVPADKILYATRDTTGTVNSVPLIAASIMSKKAAESIGALVLELTVGKAAHAKTVEEGRQMGQLMIELGKSMGIKTSVMLTRMDDPIGQTVGNGLEVMEAIRCLQGKGPSDLQEIVCSLGGQLLCDANKASSRQEGSAMIEKSLKDGTAKQKFIEMMRAQGVDKADASDLFKEDFSMLLPFTQFKTHVTANASGYVHHIDAMVCGLLAHALGAGRNKPGEKVNLAVGVELKTQVGCFLKKDAVWAVVHHDTKLTEEQRIKLSNAIVIDAEPPAPEAVTRIIEVLQ